MLRWALKQQARTMAKSARLAFIEKQIEAKQAEIAAVNSRIAEQRRIVDS